MSQLKLSNAGSLRRFLMRGVFAMLVLPLAFLVMGCGSNSGSGEIWVTGAWAPLDGTFECPTFHDTFAFDTAARTFERGGFGSWGGTIPGILLFDANGSAGLVFVRFGEERPVNWVQEGDGFVEVPVEGNYTAIAFRVATGGFQLAELNDNGMPTTNTLAEARSRFTVDTVGNYVGRWVVYLRVE